MDRAYNVEMLFLPPGGVYTDSAHGARLKWRMTEPVSDCLSLNVIFKLFNNCIT